MTQQFAVPEPQFAAPEALPEPLYMRMGDILVILSATLVSLAGGAWLIAQLGVDLSHAILAALGEAGLRVESFRTYLLQRQAPLSADARAYIQHVVFERNWGTRLRDLLTREEWARRSALCDADSPSFILGRPDYYCLYPISVAVARPG